MGQGPSSEDARVTPEELSRRLASKFLQHCFTPVELYSFKDNFRSLAEASVPSSPRSASSPSGGFLYWTEDTLIRFLALPASLDAGPLLFHSCGYLGAFPFPSLAPAILDFEALVKVVAIFTGRWKKVVKKKPDTVKLLWRSFAVVEREIVVDGEGRNEEGSGGETAEDNDALFSIGDDEDEDEDDFNLAALDAVDAVEVFKHAEKSRQGPRKARVPYESMKRIVELLLVLASLEENQPLAESVERFTGEGLDQLRETADCVVRTISSDPSRGITLPQFRRAVKRSMPYLLDGFAPLFSHFFFSKKIDFDNAKSPAPEREPLLPPPDDAISTPLMSIDLLSQLSLFTPSSRLFRRVRLLYSGSSAGYSMGSFETKVLKWNAPTVLLVSGHRLPPTPDTPPQRTFTEILPPRRYPPSSSSSNDRLIFGVFIHEPWKISHKDTFGSSSTQLFQLSPVHRVFPASTTSTDYAYFNRDDGIGFGSPVQKLKSHHRPSPFLDLGPVSLVLERGLEFGVFQHVGFGGSFMRDDESGDWQERFEVEDVEVWGCGGVKESEEQRRQWAWEEREALARRNVNLGKDIEADRALLEMAGLVGQNRSGGSMG